VVFKKYIYTQMIYFVTYLNYKGVMMTLQFDCGISVTSSETSCLPNPPV
jgi:hypothetical protein